jgi:hypothetical protein
VCRLVLFRTHLIGLTFPCANAQTPDRKHVETLNCGFHILSHFLTFGEPLCVCDSAALIIFKLLCIWKFMRKLFKRNKISLYTCTNNGKFVIGTFFVYKKIPDLKIVAECLYRCLALTHENGLLTDLVRECALPWKIITNSRHITKNVHKNQLNLAISRECQSIFSRHGFSHIFLEKQQPAEFRK